MEVEAIWIVGLELVELITEQDVFNRAITEDQREGSAVIAIECRLQYLVAGGNPSATCHHPYLALLDDLLLDEEFAQAMILK